MEEFNKLEIKDLELRSREAEKDLELQYLVDDLNKLNNTLTSYNLSTKEIKEYIQKLFTSILDSEQDSNKRKGLLKANMTMVITVTSVTLLMLVMITMCIFFIKCQQKNKKEKALEKKNNLEMTNKEKEPLKQLEDIEQ